MQTRKQTDTVWPTDLATPELGMSAAMVRVYELAAGIARGDGPVLILGESGAGKRRLAQWIHQQRRGADAAFIQVSWEELSELFMEQHLFGHVESPHARHSGRIAGLVEQAAGGTLYLQEINRFSLATQAKLAHAIADRRYEIPGTHQPLAIDARVVLGSSLNSAELLDRGALHRDLFDLVAACVIEVPPLRERKEDILPLAHLALRRFAAHYRKEARYITSTVCAALIAYPWPGNLAELEQVIQKAVLACRGASIDQHNLPVELQGHDERTPVSGENTLDTTLDNIERALIVDALKAAKGNQAKAAQFLGITERMMGLRVRKHDLAPRDYRGSGQRAP